MMNIENYWAPLLFLAALNNTYSLLSSQRLDVKCKTVESRDKIAFAFDRFKAQNCNNSEWGLQCFKGNEDNSFTVLVNITTCAFDMLSFIKLYLNDIVSVSMSGVNKFKLECEVKICPKN